jgi:hypothetical protein
MKKSNLLLSCSAAGILLLSSFTVFYPSSVPAGVSGSPGDGANCTQCHNGAASTSGGWITSDIPSGGYIPGQTYQITATNSQSGSGDYGFEVSPQNISGSLLGTLASGTNSKLVGSGKYVTQSSSSATVKAWTFSWTAPAAGTGDATFYGAFARSKSGPTTLSTLTVSEQSNTSIIEPGTSVTMISAHSGNGLFTVTIPESMRTSDGTLQILNVSGKSVYSSRYASKNNSMINIDIRNSPGGVYFMILQNSSGNKFEKFIIS